MPFPQKKGDINGTWFPSKWDKYIYTKNIHKAITKLTTTYIHNSYCGLLNYGTV
jgi:hypothetical protein